jgi:hypothetical protein
MRANALREGSISPASSFVTYEGDRLERALSSRADRFAVFRTDRMISPRGIVDAMGA